MSKPMGECKKLKVDQSDPSNTPLLDKEQAERSKWAARLEAIGRRAGSESKLLTVQDQSDELSSLEMTKLRNLVLLSGAPRTVAVRVRSFEKFEQWSACNFSELYPLTIDRVLKYCIHLDQRECGPSVIPAFKISFKWVASRLAIDLPDLDDRRLRSIQESWWSIVRRHCGKPNHFRSSLSDPWKSLCAQISMRMKPGSSCGGSSA